MSITRILADLHAAAPLVNPSLLACDFAHLAEEIHARLGGATMLCDTAWPAFDPAALVRNEIEVVVQVNGKLRDRLMVPADAAEETVREAALASARIREHTEGKTIRKIIFVPGKLLNIVAS